MAMHGRLFSAGRNDDYDRGIRYFDQGLYEAAIPELEKVIDTSGHENSILVKLAHFYLAECWSYLGSYAAGQRLFERSANCFRQALTRNPGYADLHCKLAAVYFQQDKIDDAFEELSLALAINPRYARALVQAGLCKYRLSKPELAIEFIAKAVASDPTLSNENYRKGLAFHNAKDFEAAQNVFSTLVAADLDEVAYHARLGSDFYRRGMLAEAAEQFEGAILINSNYADLHNSLGMTYHSAGKFTLAIREFNKAIEINPSYEQAVLNRSVSLDAVEAAGESVVDLILVDDTCQGS
jgi:tetratricopeptide (TPR) repeat protein